VKADIKAETVGARKRERERERERGKTRPFDAHHSKSKDAITCSVPLCPDPPTSMFSYCTVVIPVAYIFMDRKCKT
jgi:hypothetical protein